MSDSLYSIWADAVGFSSLRSSYIKANEAFDYEVGKCNVCLVNVSSLVTLYSDGEPILLNHSVPLGGLLSEDGFVQIEDRIYYLELRLNVSVEKDKLEVLREAIRSNDFSNDEIDILMDVRSADNQLSARFEDKSVPCDDSDVTFYEIPRFKHGNGESKKKGIKDGKECIGDFLILLSVGMMLVIFLLCGGQRADLTKRQTQMFTERITISLLK